jgi:cholesterol transport system auxiliary component
MDLIGSRALRGAWRRTIVVALALAGSGCAGLPSPSTEAPPDTHVLVARPLAPTQRPRRDVVIEVAPPRAWPGYDTPQIVYLQRAYELDHFATHRWADTPARMLGPLVAEALEQTGSFAAVVRGPSGVPADLRLNVELVRLQQNFMFRPSRVEVALRVELVDVHARRIVASKVFEGSEPAPTDDAIGGVTATNVAVGRILEQIADFGIVEAGRR